MRLFGLTLLLLLFLMSLVSALSFASHPVCNDLREDGVLSDRETFLELYCEHNYSYSYLSDRECWQIYANQSGLDNETLRSEGLPENLFLQYAAHCRACISKAEHYDLYENWTLDDCDQRSLMSSPLVIYFIIFLVFAIPLALVVLLIVWIARRTIYKKK